MVVNFKIGFIIKAYEVTEVELVLFLLAAHGEHPLPIDNMTVLQVFPPKYFGKEFKVLLDDCDTMI